MSSFGINNTNASVELVDIGACAGSLDQLYLRADSGTITVTGHIKCLDGTVAVDGTNAIVSFSYSLTTTPINILTLATQTAMPKNAVAVVLNWSTGTIRYAYSNDINKANLVADLSANPTRYQARIADPEGVVIGREA